MGLKDNRSGAGSTAADFEPRRCTLSPIDGAQRVRAGLKVGALSGGLTTILPGRIVHPGCRPAPHEPPAESPAVRMPPVAVLRCPPLRSAAAHSAPHPARDHGRTGSDP